MTTMYQCDRCKEQSALFDSLIRFEMPLVPRVRMDGCETPESLHQRSDWTGELCADCLESLSRWLKAEAE